MDRDIFRRLALVRLREAKALLEGGYYQGAYYLCGYAVECGIKACLAKKTKRYAFPPEPKAVSQRYYTHSLSALLDEVGGPLAAEMKNHPKWGLTTEWSEGYRYSIDTAPSLAQEFYAAVADKKSGVLTCIKKYW
ncbi:MAG TPA: HEPN domain-containing protein [Bryobacterales bacterium]|nr:HEPN domain-containing protein [Bryobacterales bacterium]